MADHTPLSPHNPFVREKAHFAAIKRHFLEAPSMQDLYADYVTMEGTRALSMVVIEKQCGRFKSGADGGSGGIDFERLAQEVCWVIREEGDKRRDPAEQDRGERRNDVSP